ncbi:hypothetical protein C8R43DRAFT_1143472 [Mycena crocata]|nr:hypothetical protein C8R43DRAFT_1143472 [Mycena crocata]
MILWRGMLRLLPTQSHADEYELLPEASHHDSRPRARRRPHVCLRVCTMRRLLVLLAVIPLLTMVGVLLSGIPPTYSDIREYEKMLPQHNVSALSALDPHIYLRFPGHLWGHGLNNVLQEAAQDRLCVVTFTLAVHIYDFALRATRIPLNAFVTGPLAGGQLDQNAAHKRAVSAAFYEKVCPRSAIRTVSSVGSPTNVEGCALRRVDSSEQPTFDRFLFGSPRVLSLLPGLNASPILGAFAWSPLVHSAVARNFAVLRPTVRSVFMYRSRSEYDLVRVEV